MLGTFLAWLFWWRPPCLSRVVVVSLKAPDSEGIRGILYECRGPWLRLKQPIGIKAGHAPEPIDGDVLIRRDNIAFITEVRE